MLRGLGCDGLRCVQWTLRCAALATAVPPRRGVRAPTCAAPPAPPPAAHGGAPAPQHREGAAGGGLGGEAGRRAWRGWLARAPSAAGERERTADLPPAAALPHAPCAGHPDGLLLLPARHHHGWAGIAGRVVGSWQGSAAAAHPGDLRARSATRARVPARGGCLTCPTPPPPHPHAEYCSRGSLTDVLQRAREDPAAAAQLTWRRRLEMASAGRAGGGRGLLAALLVCAPCRLLDRPSGPSAGGQQEEMASRGSRAKNAADLPPLCTGAGCCQGHAGAARARAAHHPPRPQGAQPGAG